MKVWVFSIVDEDKEIIETYAFSTLEKGYDWLYRYVSKRITEVDKMKAIHDYFYGGDFNENLVAEEYEIDAVLEYDMDSEEVQIDNED